MYHWTEEVECLFEVVFINVREDRSVKILDLSIRGHHDQLESRCQVRVRFCAANAYPVDAPDIRSAHFACMPLFGFFRGAVTANFGADRGGGAQTTGDCEVDTRRKERVNES